jgi:hypothetical protein
MSAVTFQAVPFGRRFVDMFPGSLVFMAFVTQFGDPFFIRPSLLPDVRVVTSSAPLLQGPVGVAQPIGRVVMTLKAKFRNFSYRAYLSRNTEIMAVGTVIQNRFMNHPPDIAFGGKFTWRVEGNEGPAPVHLEDIEPPVKVHRLAEETVGEHLGQDTLAVQDNAGNVFRIARHAKYGDGGQLHRGLVRGVDDLTL